MKQGKKRILVMVNSMTKKSFWYWYFLLFLVFGIIFVRLFFLNVLNHESFAFLLQEKTEIYVEGDSAPRGRILDRNGVVLVDNMLVKRISYTKMNQITFLEEINLAKELMKYFEVDEANEVELRNYYALLHEEEVAGYITDEERIMVKERKLESSMLDKWKRERINSDVLMSMSHEEKVIAKFYALMNTGYSYQNKVLLKDADAKLVASIEEAKIPGIFVDYAWKRTYPYGELLRSIFGNISEGLPFDSKEEYLEKGYGLSDIVGISYLEQEYEEYLRGEKAIYLVNADKSLSLQKEAVRGNDIYLSIDINVQKKLDEVVKDTLINVKKLNNTEYLKETFAIMGDPNTGGILAMTGRRILENGRDISFQEITSDLILSSFTVGSIVKGASHTVGYLNGVIEPNKKIKDSCVKLYFVPEKCSYKELGYLDDISALKWSSNYYQFLTAIKLAGKRYTYNMKLDAGEEVFHKYREVFSMYGLGSKTGIDLPNEQVGMIGKNMSDDLLLNLAIGQYDTYTPVELLQYIQTIYGSGSRKKLSLMKEVRSPNDELLVSYEPQELSKISMDEGYYERIREGFRQVLYNGTGSGYVRRDINAYGKTGTSESFYDSNNDGKVDTKTISSTFAMIGPSDNGDYSMVIVTPNLSHYDGVKDYTAPFNRYISTEMSEYMLRYKF